MSSAQTQKTTQHTHKANTEKSAPLKNQDSSSRPSSRDEDKRRTGGSGNRRGDRDNARSKPEFDHTVLDIRRVSRVIAGGRRFSFRAAVVVGDRKGRVGVGVGKAADTPLAIEKAIRDAKRKIITVHMNDTNSIPCDVKAKYNASRVMVKPSTGKGIIAGGAVRPVIELAGLQDVSTKLLSRSKNSLNNARVAISALLNLPKVKSEKSDKEEEDNKKEKQEQGSIQSAS